MKFLIALLTAATGILHLIAGFNLLGGTGGTNWLLVLNGVGYLVLLVVFWMASGNGGIIRWILLAYALITLIGYFAINAGNNFGLDNTLGLVIKAIELLLIILLFLYRGSRPVPARATPAPTTASRGPAPVDTRGVSPAVTAAAANTAAGASLGAAATTAAVTMDDRVGMAVDTTVADMDDAVDAMGDKMDAGYDAVAGATGDTAGAMGDAAGDAVDAMGDAADAVGDKMEAGYDAVADAAGDAADAMGDAAGDAVDAMGDAADAVGDKMEGGYDAATDSAMDAGEAMRGGAVAAAGLVERDVVEAGDILAADAAELDAADLAAEPTADELRAELERYIQSLGSTSSEFRREIEYVEGIGAAYGQALRGVGINTVLDLLVNGATRRGRKHLSDQSGISQSNILTWVNHIDLFRIKGVAQEYADLLEQSGVDTVVELAQRNPTNLHKRMLDINAQKSLVRRAPHASEVQSWVEQARNLRRLIYY
ncbi:MAG: DUF4332 domain-containing protein [Candidatus Promineofilum sp.]|uniref:DUF4332 domain-containing protein n=1 Tax=Promineifilum sp. TaxID=2664178 RepID=UPI0024119E16|nr:DUF4332 domain-containing protein [Promineifilum sp.]